VQPSPREVPPSLSVSVAMGCSQSATVSPLAAAAPRSTTSGERLATSNTVCHASALRRHQPRPLRCVSVACGNVLHHVRVRDWDAGPCVSQRSITCWCRVRAVWSDGDDTVVEQPTAHDARAALSCCRDASVHAWRSVVA
jgi:hypothetical protein